MAKRKPKSKKITLDDVKPSPPVGEAIEADLVARRIVMRRETWDKLVDIANALQAQKGLDVMPTDVAVIALEAGLAEFREKLPTEKPRP